MGVGEKVVAQPDTISGMTRQSNENKPDFQYHVSMSLARPTLGAISPPRSIKMRLAIVSWCGRNRLDTINKITQKLESNVIHDYLIYVDPSESHSLPAR